MKVLFSAALAGAVLFDQASLAAEPQETDPDEAPLVARGAAPTMVPPALESSGRVLNPDRKCDDAIITAEGREGEGEFQRRPASATPPPMHYAVDYQIQGCDVLIATTGELHQLPTLPENPAFIPAQ